MNLAKDGCSQLEDLQIRLDPKMNGTGTSIKPNFARNAAESPISAVQSNDV